MNKLQKLIDLQERFETNLIDDDFSCIAPENCLSELKEKISQLYHLDFLISPNDCLDNKEIVLDVLKKCFSHEDNLQIYVFYNLPKLGLQGINSIEQYCIDNNINF